MSNTNLKVFKIAQLLGIGVVLWLSLFLRVSCASNPIVTISGITTTDRTRLDALVSSISEDVKSNADITWDFLTSYPTASTETYSIEINMSQYKECETKRKRDIMETTLSAIANSDLSVTNRNKLYNFIANEDESTSSLVRQLSNDVDADFGRAYYYVLKPFSGVLGVILGAISLAIFVFVGLTITLDIAYINIPFFQVWVTDDEKRKNRLVSFEAIKAVEDAHSAEGTKRKNIMTAYFGSKVKQLVALSVCILYLVSGNIFSGLASIVDMFSGILK